MHAVAVNRDAKSVLGQSAESADREADKGTEAALAANVIAQLFLKSLHNSAIRAARPDIPSLRCRWCFAVAELKPNTTASGSSFPRTSTLH